MTIIDKKLANAVSGKTARPCDCCIRNRARWYCSADDAFLCQTCDGSVHSANSLARRHERVRLKTASLKPSNDHHHPNLPSWQRGLTRKPRTTRRPGKHHSKSDDPTRMNVTVPELSTEDTTSSQDGETEEQLLYRVPIFDPFVTELRSSPSGYECDDTRPLLESGLDLITFENPESVNTDEYMPSDLEEFAANVESLLGKGLEDESYGIEELGLLDCMNNNNSNSNDYSNEGNLHNHLVVIKDPLFEMSLNYDDDEQKEIVMIEQSSMVNEFCRLKKDDEKENKERELKRRKIMLSLDYEGVSEAWGSNCSPWMNGQKPEINLDDCWPYCMQQGTCGHEGRQSLYGDNNHIGGIGAIGDGGREARVSRYREKRRTRLFSKKIRYEVRKLNAEKRPRMKGRFVKRSAFVAATTAFPLKK